MNALASALEISAKIVRESRSEHEASCAIWGKIIEIRPGQHRRNAYNESMIRGYMSVLKVLCSPEVL